MAMQTGVASSKFLILLGAGLTGSIILRNGHLSDVLSEVQELIKGINEVDISSYHYDPTLLAAQICQLAQEVRDLTVSRPVTIINGENTSSGSLASYIMPAAAVGAMGYCFMWWKGWSFTDVMFVTKHNMANAVATVSKQLEQVSTALSTTKRHLTQRLENLDGKLDEQKETSMLIKDEVSEVSSDLSQMGFDIESIQKMVYGLEGKIDYLENKQDMTNSGISYLCQVAGGIKDGINAKIFQEVSVKLQPASLSLTFSEGKPLEGLQFLAEIPKDGKLKEFKSSPIMQKGFNEETTSNDFSKTTTIHRSFPRGIVLRQAGVVL